MQCERRCTADLTAPCETGKQRSLLSSDIDLVTSLGKYEGDRDGGYINTNNTPSLETLRLLLKKTRETYSGPVSFSSVGHHFRRRKHGGKPVSSTLCGGKSFVAVCSV
jgi:hypothetical protein